MNKLCGCSAGHLFKEYLMDAKPSCNSMYFPRLYQNVVELYYNKRTERTTKLYPGSFIPKYAGGHTQTYEQTINAGIIWS